MPESEGRSIFNQGRQKSDRTVLTVSVIITTKDSEKFLGSCINSIKESTYKDIEIIVVDNFSDDRTLDVAVAHGCRYFSKGPERSAQRNFGVKMSTGQYILILDVDMTIDKGLIAECVEMSSSVLKEYLAVGAGGFLVPDECRDIIDALVKGIDGLYIPEHIVNVAPGGFMPYWIKVRDFERSFYDGTRIDAIRFMKKARWVNYDTNLSGTEDWQHDRSFRGIKGVTSKGLYHNEGGFSVVKYLKKKAYYAQWTGRYKKLQQDCPELSFKYRLWTVFTEKGKWKKLLKHPLLTLGMYFLVIMKGIIYLCVKKY